MTPIIAPPEIIQQAQDILDALPRSDWPEDEWYDVAPEYDLYVGREAAKGKYANLVHSYGLGSGKDESVAQTWENIQ